MITMKKNNTKYLLGLALVGVWGVLGFRIYEKVNPSNNFQLVSSTINTPVESNLPTRNYQLSLGYDDPFLEKKLKRAKPVAVQQPSDKITRRRKNQKKRPEKKRVIFPQIIYKGNMKMKGGREVALMNVDGQFVQLGKSENYKDLNVLQVYPDSVRIAFSGVEKTITRRR